MVRKSLNFLYLTEDILINCFHYVPIYQYYTYTVIYKIHICYHAIPYVGFICLLGKLSICLLNVLGLFEENAVDENSYWCAYSIFYTIVIVMTI